MKKVITFSLWGNNPTYNIGAIKNAELAKEFYLDFECWFYIHKETVPESTIQKIEQIGNSKIIYKNENILNEECFPRMWRFEAIDDEDVEIMMPRDTDTRILEREVLAVRDWLHSDKIFHIMRDHPHHTFCILAGMFGTKKIKNISWKNLIKTFFDNDKHFYDQNFLKDIIYPLIKDNSIIHATFYKLENHSINFPIPYNKDYNFVGEYVYFDESRSLIHIDELKKSL
jgi:protein O-GlcNAc transferase